MGKKRQPQVSAVMAGTVLAIYIRGGSECLWMHMYLDIDKWQMTCDSDVGHYAFYWGHQFTRHRNFVEFCTEWLADENWLLRKCVGERHCQREFLRAQAEESLRKMVVEYSCGDEDFDIELINGILEEASGYEESSQTWALAVQMLADRQDFVLPEEWYECIEEDYTPMQKRFAEICRETIVPELKRLMEFEKKMIKGGVYKA